MAIGTYSELNTAVANWLARDDLTSRIPEFIALAEAKFNRDLRSSKQETRTTLTATISDDYLDLPSDFQTMRRIRLSSVTGKPRLQYMSGSQMDDYRYSNSNETGQPQYYTIVGSEIELCRTPDLAYSVEILYRANIAALTSVNTTNWLLTLAPDLYLYGTLMEAAPYMKEDARLPVWSAGFNYAIEGLNKLSQEQSYSAGPMEVRATGPNP